MQSTSFGYARLILKWQSWQNRSQVCETMELTSFGQLRRQKVRISRESAMKVFKLYGSSSSIPEVEHPGEVGTGLGPTLELSRRDLKIWRDDDPLRIGSFVFHPRGYSLRQSAQRTSVIPSVRISSV